MKLLLLMIACSQDATAKCGDSRQQATIALSIAAGSACQRPACLRTSPNLCFGTRWDDKYGTGTWVVTGGSFNLLISPF